MVPLKPFIVETLLIRRGWNEEVASVGFSPEAKIPLCDSTRRLPNRLFRGPSALARRPTLEVQVAQWCGRGWGDAIGLEVAPTRE